MFLISTKNITKHFGFIHLVKVLGNNLYFSFSYNSALIISLSTLMKNFLWCQLLFFDKNVDTKSLLLYNRNMSIITLKWRLIFQNNALERFSKLLHLCCCCQMLIWLCFPDSSTIMKWTSLEQLACVWCYQLSSP